jgi:integrase
MNGSLYKRGSVYWVAIRVNGKLYRKSTGKTTKREAIDFLDELKNEAGHNKLPDAKRINYKFAELAQKYNAFVAIQKGYKSKKTFIRQLVEEFGNLDINDLNIMIVEQWQTRLLKVRTPATANRKLACLKHMLSKAVDWNMASEETLKQMRKVKFIKENNRKLRFLNVDECQRLIACCPAHLKPIVITALNTGMRRGEILSLMWERVDLRHGFISLEDTKSGEGREIPINNTLRMMFEEMPHSIESVYVFTGKDGDPLTDVKHSFTTALKKAEIRNATFHTLDIRSQAS